MSVRKQISPFEAFLVAYAFGIAAVALVDVGLGLWFVWTVQGHGLPGVVGILPIVVLPALYALVEWYRERRKRVA